MAAKAAATVQSEFTTLATAVTALVTSLETELADYGQETGDDTLSRDAQEAYRSAVAELGKFNRQLAGLRSQVGTRYKVL